MNHPLWPSVAAAIATGQSGQKEAAKEQLNQAWAACDEADHAMRCIVAHFLADVQDDVRSELDWDQRALAAHTHVEDDELTHMGVSSASAFLPSLHLNLGDAWLRAGDRDRAQRHLEQARAAEQALDDDPYGAMVRRGIAALGTRVEASC